MGILLSKEAQEKHEANKAIATVVVGLFEVCMALSAVQPLDCNDVDATSRYPLQPHSCQPPGPHF